MVIGEAPLSIYKSLISAAVRRRGTIVHAAVLLANATSSTASIETSDFGVDRAVCSTHAALSDVVRHPAGLCDRQFGRCQRNNQLITAELRMTAPLYTTVEPTKVTNMPRQFITREALSISRQRRIFTNRFASGDAKYVSPSIVMPISRRCDSFPFSTGELTYRLQIVLSAVR